MDLVNALPVDPMNTERPFREPDAHSSATDKSEFSNLVQNATANDEAVDPNDLAELESNLPMRA